MQKGSNQSGNTIYINVADVSTYPKELEKYVYKTFENLPAYIHERIKSNHVEYESDVRIAIEDYFRPDASKFYEDVVSILDAYNIILFHGTKVLEVNKIKENGLKTNEWDTYKKSMSEVFVQLGYTEDEQKEAMHCIEHEYNRKYGGDRESQLCFFSCLSMIDLQDGTAGYEQFCENIGGEIARWALKEHFPKLYQRLHENGEAVICKFVIPFQDVAWYLKESIAYEFVSFYAAKYFFDFNYEIQFDGNTNKNIPGDNLIELISYNKSIDY